VRNVSLPDSASPNADTDIGTGIDIGTEPSAPTLEVVAGDPSPEELAALVAVLSVVAQSSAVTDRPEPARVDGWAASWRGIGAPVPLGPGAWGAGSVG
jgi:Acyl-CoA carboxylase epsilon subunit